MREEPDRRKRAGWVRYGGRFRALFWAVLVLAALVVSGWDVSGLDTVSETSAAHVVLGSCIAVVGLPAFYWISKCGIYLGPDCLCVHNVFGFYREPVGEVKWVRNDASLIPFLFRSVDCIAVDYGRYGVVRCPLAAPGWSDRAVLELCQALRSPATT